MSKPTNTPDLSTWVPHGAGWWTLRGVGSILRTHHGFNFIPTKGTPMLDFESLDDAKKAAILGSDFRRPSEGWTREQAGDWR